MFKRDAIILVHKNKTGLEAGYPLKVIDVAIKRSQTRMRDKIRGDNSFFIKTDSPAENTGHLCENSGSTKKERKFDASLSNKPIMLLDQTSNIHTGDLQQDKAT
ncbi:hypothetical protein ACOME3_008888 [Neoechinorhynchus agilis]